MKLRQAIAVAVNSLAWGSWVPTRSELRLGFHQGLRERRLVGLLSRDDRNAYVLDRVRDTVRYAREFVPYYRQLLSLESRDFPKNLEDYRRCPILTKSQIRANEHLLLSDRVHRDTLNREASGGSTGEPVEVFLSDREVGWKLAGHTFYQQLLGIPIGAPIATFYGGELDPSIGATWRTRVFRWLQNLQPHGCFRVDRDYVLQVHADLSRFKPALLISYASAAATLARQLKEVGITPNYPTSAVLTGGERLEEFERNAIEQVFGVPAVQRYGSREIGLMAYELPGRLSYHVDHAYCFLEPRSEPDAESIADVIVTPLAVRAMPLLRYELGDIGQFPSDWSPAGPAYELLSIKGRTSDYIRLPNNGLVHGITFPHLLKDFDVSAYQVVQQADYSVDVYLVLGRTRASVGFIGQVEEIVAKNLVGVQVRFHYVHELPRTNQGKLRPVISLVAPELPHR